MKLSHRATASGTFSAPIDIVADVREFLLGEMSVCHKGIGSMRTESPRITTRTASLATMVRGRIAKPWRGPAGAFLFLAATPVSAQQPGDTVRVSGGLFGVVVEADSAGLRLSSGYAPYAAMGSLEVWRGAEHQAGRGFKYGLVAGGILGGVVNAGIGYLLADDGVSGNYALAALLGGAVGGLSGGVVGAVIGRAVKRDIWMPVPIPGGLSLLPVPGGLSLRWAVGGRPPH